MQFLVWLIFGIMSPTYSSEPVQILDCPEQVRELPEAYLHPLASAQELVDALRSDWEEHRRIRIARELDPLDVVPDQSSFVVFDHFTKKRGVWVGGTLGEYDWRLNDNKILGLVLTDVGYQIAVELPETGSVIFLDLDEQSARTLGWGIFYGFLGQSLWPQMVRDLDPRPQR